MTPTFFRNRPPLIHRLMPWLAVVMCLFVVFPAAADFQRGMNAYNDGLYDKAIEEWLPMAELGDAKAQLNLGMMYYEAKGGAQNFKEASRWLSKAAEQGHADAEAYYALALMNSNGWGVRQNYIDAVKWYSLAAEQGLADAQYNLALMYTNGLGTQQDNRAAVKWLLQAAEQGLADAQHTLGTMYVNGEGVGQDYVQACMWFDISTASGKNNAEQTCDTLTEKMTPAQREEAQDAAQAWLNKHNS